jgi:large subunit ribosomal protein L31
VRFSRRHRVEVAGVAAGNLSEAPMKEGIHPNYREVCFQDLSNGFKFVTRSCVQTKETVKLDDGRELPLVKLETTSETHPFYTGTQKSVDNLGGRVEKFRNKFARVGLRFGSDGAASATCPKAAFGLPFLRPGAANLPAAEFPSRRGIADHAPVKSAMPTPPWSRSAPPGACPRALLLLCAAYVLPGVVRPRPLAQRRPRRLRPDAGDGRRPQRAWLPDAGRLSPADTALLPTGWARPSLWAVALARRRLAARCPSRCCWPG